MLIFLGITCLTQRYNVKERNEKIQEKIKIFSRINELAYEEINEDARENHFDEEEKKTFYLLDEEYHKAKDIYEKHRASKKMVDFLIQGELSAPELGDTDTDKERDAEFTKILETFLTME